MIEQGIQLLESGDVAGARKLFEQALEASASEADTILAYQNLGVIHTKDNNFTAALEYFLPLTKKLTPNDANAWDAAGSCFSNMMQVDEAIQCFQRSVELAPKSAIAFANLGFALFQKQDYLKAEKQLKKACKLNRKYANSFNVLGHVLAAQGRFDDAALSYERAIAINPEEPEALSGLIYSNRSICYWRDLAIQEQMLVEQSARLIEQGKPASVSPFSTIFLDINQSQQQAMLANYAASLHQPNAYSHSTPLGQPASDRIRIAYISSCFRSHVVCYLVHTLFEMHDKKKFEVYAYASVAPDDSVHYVKKIRDNIHQFTDLSKLTDQQAAEKIHNDEITVLIDLDGYTQGARFNIIANKPAPVQVNYLGFPSTTGAPWYDYIIGDAIVTPPEWDDSFSENPVRLPHCYQINNYRAIPIGPKPTRKKAKLPEDAVVYCCFNISRKIEPKVFNCWMEILRQVPNGILWILTDDKDTQRNLIKQAKKAKIKKKRLIFAERVTSGEHLARQQAADVFLDAFFCNAHTTASDALWCGLPVITTRGNIFANRVAASIVSSAGIPECIAENTDDYILKAVALGNNPDQLKAMKQKVTEAKLSAPLFDTQRYVDALERAYVRMLDNAIEGSHGVIEIND